MSLMLFLLYGLRFVALLDTNLKPIVRFVNKKLKAVKDFFVWEIWQ